MTKMIHILLEHFVLCWTDKCHLIAIPAKYEFVVWVHSMSANYLLHTWNFSKTALLLLRYDRWCKIDKFVNQRASLAMRFFIGRSIESSQIQPQWSLICPNLISYKLLSTCAHLWDLILSKCSNFKPVRTIYRKENSELIGSCWWPFSTPSMY